MFPNSGYAYPSHIRSGHLDIRDAVCAETNDMLIISYYFISRFWGRVRLGAAVWVPPFGRQISVPDYWAPELGAGLLFT